MSKRKLSYARARVCVCVWLCVCVRAREWIGDNSRHYQCKQPPPMRIRCQRVVECRRQCRDAMTSQYTHTRTLWRGFCACDFVAVCLGFIAPAKREQNSDNCSVCDSNKISCMIVGLLRQTRASGRGNRTDGNRSRRLSYMCG